MEEMEPESYTPSDTMSVCLEELKVLRDMPPSTHLYDTAAKLTHLIGAALSPPPPPPPPNPYKEQLSKLITVLLDTVAQLKTALFSDNSPDIAMAHFEKLIETLRAVDLQDLEEKERHIVPPPPPPPPPPPSAPPSVLQNDEIHKLKEEHAKMAELLKELQEKALQLEATSKQGQTESFVQTDLLEKPSASELDSIIHCVSQSDISPPHIREMYRERRRRSVEETYKRLFYQNGFSYIWVAIVAVFSNEFLPRPSERPERHSRASFVDKTADTFLTCFTEQILSKMQSPEAFQRSVDDTTVTLTKLYLGECEVLRCKPNSSVLTILEESMKVPEGETINIDLGENLVGSVGLKALLPVLQEIHAMETLDLSGNGLQNESVAYLCEALAAHPTLTSLNLAGNRLSRSAGKEVVRLLSRNPTILHVDLSETRVEPSLQNRIRELLLKRCDKG